MQPNNSLSHQQNNQFMPSMPKNNSGPSFQNFMQACFSNPSFFQSMRHFYSSQAQKQPTQVGNNSYQGVATQSYHQSQPNLANQSRKDVKYDQDSKSQHFEREANVPKANDMKRKPANPLAKYFPTQNIQNQKPNQPQSKLLTQPPSKPSFEDKPIKSNYIAAVNNNSQAFDLNNIKENQSVNTQNPKKKVKNFDDEPIKGTAQYQIDNFNKEPQQKIKASTVATQDQRPIKGLVKDFKQVVKQRFPGSLDNEDDEQREDQSSAMQIEPRTFLKRGSRQHLSSAMNRSKQPKKNLDSSLNKSGIQEQRDRSVTPKRLQPENRTISQSKGIQKKNNKVQQKLTSKLPTRKSDSSDDQPVIGKNKPSLAKQRPPKPQQKNTKAIQKIVTKEIPSKLVKRKNVFNDGSQSSSSGQQPSPTFKPRNNNQKNNKTNIQIQDYQDKIEIIQGVFLTQSQFDQIIQKYGKVKEVPKQTQSEKVAALRRKYNEMIALKDQQMQKHKQQLQREREEFQKHKADQLTKIKNERRVMQRQAKGGMSNQNLQKQKQQLQNLKQELEKQRQDFKRKDKNNKIIIQKYKKQNQELKSKLDKIEGELSVGKKSVSISGRTQDNFYEEKLVSNKSVNGSLKGKKVEQQSKNQEVTYKDIKKTSKPPIQQNKQVKSKYQYVEQQTFSKNKSFSSKMEKKEQKIQNKWASHKFTNSDQSESQKQGNQQYQVKLNQNNKASQWSPAMKLSDLTKTNLSVKMVNEQMIDSLFRYQKNIEYLRYIQSTKLATRTVVNTSRNNTNSYTTKTYSDRTKELVYDNGTRKVSCQNGYSIVYFKNGDIKQTLPDKTVLYYFKQKEVDQITLSNAINIYRFENNQVEIHFQNGYIEIRHPDGTIKVLGDHVRK